MFQEKPSFSYIYSGDDPTHLTHLLFTHSCSSTRTTLSREERSWEIPSTESQSTSGKAHSETAWAPSPMSLRCDCSTCPAWYVTSASYQDWITAMGHLPNTVQTVTNDTFMFSNSENFSHDYSQDNNLGDSHSFHIAQHKHKHQLNKM